MFEEAAFLGVMELLEKGYSWEAALRQRNLINGPHILKNFREAAIRFGKAREAQTALNRTALQRVGLRSINAVRTMVQAVRAGAATSTGLAAMSLFVIATCVYCGVQLRAASRDIELPGQGIKNLGDPPADPASGTGPAPTEQPLGGSINAGFEPATGNPTKPAVSTPKPTPSKPTQTKPVKPSANFAGKWDSGVGKYWFPRELNLTQAGNHVVGDYKFEFDEGKRHIVVTGTIDGTVEGDTVSFTWTDSEGRKGSGAFTMYYGAKEFSGWYADVVGAKSGNQWRARNRH